MVAILAGGAATRLDGCDKGLQPLGGRPLVARVVDAIGKMLEVSTPLFAADGLRKRCSSTDEGDAHRGKRAGCALRESNRAPTDVLIVANRHHDEYAQYARTIHDVVPGFRGPLAGIAAALASCTAPLLLTVPVDCPDPPRDLARRLIEAMGTGDVGAFVAHDGERRQPLFGLYRRDLAASAAAAVEAGQGASAWQTSIAARELDFSDCRSQFQNLNSREEFAAYAALHRLDA